jgi:uncharacterized protein
MDKKEIRRKALEKGLSINYIMKDKEISKIFLILENKINDIFLKGGTGINRVYLEETKRFSEDIDFDVYSKENINKVKEDIYKILKKELKDYDVQKPRIMNKTIRYDVLYVNEFENKEKIRLEYRIINKKPKNVNLKIINNGFVSYKTCLYYIYTIEELIFQKLFALINRIEGKDIYDIYYLLEQKYNKKELKEIFKQKEQEQIIITAIERLKEFLNKKETLTYINNSTNHFISKDKRIYFEIMIKNLIIKLKQQI